MKIKITENTIDAANARAHAPTRPRAHAPTRPRAHAPTRLFAQADYLQWYWGASHTTPAPDVGQGFQDDLLLLACGQPVTHHHAGCTDILVAVPTAK